MIGALTRLLNSEPTRLARDAAETEKSLARIQREQTEAMIAHRAAVKRLTKAFDKSVAIAEESLRQSAADERN